MFFENEDSIADLLQTITLVRGLRRQLPVKSCLNWTYQTIQNFASKP
jgi:hypothetical protein